MTAGEPNTRMVLDTNVVLDWLHFDDAATRDLAACVLNGRASIVTNAVVLDELERVLTYPALKISDERQAQILARYRAQTRQFEMPPGFARYNLLLPEFFPRCRDTDDQQFLALAFHSKSQALVTKDKALLKLARKVRRFEMRILEPSAIRELAQSGQ